MTIQTYRGWDIDWCDYSRTFQAIGPNYEPEWRGAEHGWEDEYDQRIEGASIEDVIDQIEDFFGEAIK